MKWTPDERAAIHKVADVLMRRRIVVEDRLGGLSEAFPGEHERVADVGEKTKHAIVRWMRRYADDAWVEK